MVKTKCYKYKIIMNKLSISIHIYGQNMITARLFPYNFYVNNA